MKAGIILILYWMTHNEKIKRCNSLSKKQTLYVS